jgi:hypothetical protein
MRMDKISFKIHERKDIAFCLPLQIFICEIGCMRGFWAYFLSAEYFSLILRPEIHWQTGEWAVRTAVFCRNPFPLACSSIPD